MSEELRRKYDIDPLAIPNHIESHFEVLRDGSGPDMFRVRIENHTQRVEHITHFPLIEVQTAVAVPPMTVQILARKILDMAECGTGLADNATESDIPGILSDTIENITDLCQAELKAAEEGKAVE